MVCFRLAAECGHRISLNHVMFLGFLHTLVTTDTPCPVVSHAVQTVTWVNSEYIFLVSNTHQSTTDGFSARVQERQESGINYGTCQTM